jgi:hypothetical protein
VRSCDSKVTIKALGLPFDRLQEGILRLRGGASWSEDEMAVSPSALCKGPALKYCAPCGSKNKSCSSIFSERSILPKDTSLHSEL